ncbi:MAG TPA: FAD-dependent oxidoreductase [Mycobacteriales bacterium]
MKIDHQIVVLGAGYAGMMCAVRLARRTRRLGVGITLVNPSVRFTERLRMHQLAAGQELAHHPIPDLLASTGVAFLRGTATMIDAVAGRITVDGTETLRYDTLVYAVGSRADTGAVPGAAEHTFILDDPHLAHRFSIRLAELATVGGGTVTVCGGGLTGVEAAAEVAEAHPGLRVTLVSRDIPGAKMGEAARAHLHRALERLGVTCEVGVAVTRVLPDAVELDDGRMVDTDVCLWTAGVRVPALAAESGIETDDRGLVVVDATLRSVSHPNVHAVGDAVAVRQEWGQVHGTCQSGVPTAVYVADAIARRLRGRRVKPFRFGYVHQPVSVGRRDAVVQFTYADDTPRRWYLAGRPATLYKEMVSSSPLPTYRLSRRLNIPAGLLRGSRATRA